MDWSDQIYLNIKQKFKIRNLRFLYIWRFNGQVFKLQYLSIHQKNN